MRSQFVRPCHSVTRRCHVFAVIEILLYIRHGVMGSSLEQVESEKGTNASELSK